MTGAMTHLGPLVAQMAARSPAVPSDVVAMVEALAMALGGHAPSLLHDRTGEGRRAWASTLASRLGSGEVDHADLADALDRARAPRGGEPPHPARVEASTIVEWARLHRRRVRAEAEGRALRDALEARTRAPSEAAATSRDAYRAISWARDHGLIDSRGAAGVIDMLLPGPTPEVWAALRRALGDETARRVWALLGHARRLRRQTDDIAREVASLREELRVVRGARDPIATAEARARLDEAMERAHREGGRITRAADAEAARLAREGA
jgi:hypothetical protein